MDSTLDNQVIRLKCALCSQPIGERIARMRERSPPACSACAVDIQIYAERLRAKLAMAEEALQTHWRAVDQALAEDWKRLVGQTSG